MTGPSKAVAWALIVLALAGGIAVPATASDEAPRMTKEELRRLLGDPDLVVIDVRVGGDQAPTRIPGSKHERAAEVGTWAENYPKGKRIVLYCA